MRKIMEHVGEPTIAAAVAPARSPPLAMNGYQLAAPEGVFKAISELEFDLTANLAAEAGRDYWTHPAGADAEPIPDLEFDQTLGLQIYGARMAHAAERGWVWFRRWLGAVSFVG